MDPQTQPLPQPPLSSAPPLSAATPTSGGFPAATVAAAYQDSADSSPRSRSSFYDEQQPQFSKLRLMCSGRPMMKSAGDGGGQWLEAGGVSDFVLSNGMWDRNKQSWCLTHEAVLQVYGMTLPNEQLRDDAISWGLEPNRRFTIKSAYLLLKDINGGGDEALWRKVWQWEGPEKIKQFLWLVSHRKIMTNEERRRRHIAPDVVCPECSDMCENVDHGLGVVDWRVRFGRPSFRRWLLATLGTSILWIGGGQVGVTLT
ncbi:Putative ribonuclease H protein At1g65750 [Linum perenne]